MVNVWEWNRVLLLSVHAVMSDVQRAFCKFKISGGSIDRFLFRKYFIKTNASGIHCKYNHSFSPELMYWAQPSKQSFSPFDVIRSPDSSLWATQPSLCLGYVWPHCAPDAFLLVTAVQIAYGVHYICSHSSRILSSVNGVQFECYSLFRPAIFLQTS